MAPITVLLGVRGPWKGIPTYLLLEIYYDILLFIISFNDLSDVPWTIIHTGNIFARLKQTEFWYEMSTAASLWHCCPSQMVTWVPCYHQQTTVLSALWYSKWPGLNECCDYVSTIILEFENALVKSNFLLFPCMVLFITYINLIRGKLSLAQLHTLKCQYLVVHWCLQACSSYSLLTVPIMSQGLFQ